MTAEDIPQGDLALLDHPGARELLNSAIPARLGYVAPDGTPRVTPIWFTWNGNEFVFGTAGSSPKVTALQTNPAVAVTIDSESPPTRSCWPAAGPRCNSWRELWRSMPILPCGTSVPNKGPSSATTPRKP